MTRRDPAESDSEPAGREERAPKEERRRLDSVIPELIKKAVIGGYDKASEAQETIKSLLSDSKLPKEIANALLSQVEDTKNGLFRVVAKEIRGFLEATDFQRELQKLLTTVSFEIKTEIRFIPNDAGDGKLGRPQVKADVKMKREGKDEKRRRTPAGESDAADREGDESPSTAGSPDNE